VRVLIVAVGKIKPHGLREAIDEYLARVRRHLPIEEVEIRDGNASEVAAAVRKRVPVGARVVALDAKGQSFDSSGFARWLERRGSEGKGIVVFVIGAADGLPKEVLSMAAERVSLSSMTFPHRIARVLLAEQIYRATAILRGEPYAK
jgi:23S rRNA (pseudouridine1915-N3)-methyltransferase